MYGIGDQEGELPEYRLNDTADQLEKIIDDGLVELWSFWDGVDWNKKYAIKVDGHFKMVMDEESETILFKIFKAVCIAVNGHFDHKKVYERYNNCF